MKKTEEFRPSHLKYKHKNNKNRAIESNKLMPEQSTSKLTSLGPGEGWPCFDLCLSECERAGVQRLNVTSADNLLVVQSVRGESSQHIYCMFFLVWLEKTQTRRVHWEPPQTQEQRQTVPLWFSVCMCVRGLCFNILSIAAFSPSAGCHVKCVTAVDWWLCDTFQAHLPLWRPPGHRLWHRGQWRIPQLLQAQQ